MARPSSKSLKWGWPKSGFPKEKLIVVEGADDFYAIGHLSEIHKIDTNFRIEVPGTDDRGSLGGYEALRDSIDTRLVEGGLQVVGFVVDADDKIADRWKSLRDLLISERCGFAPENVPERPDPGGTIIVQKGKPTVGIWLMPDNESAGALEIFLRTMVRIDDPLWAYAEACVAGLPVFPSTNPNWINKAILHTWLAWHKETPGKPIGQAVDSRDFNPNADNALAFVSWLRRLFDLPTAP